MPFHITFSYSSIFQVFIHIVSISSKCSSHKVSTCLRAFTRHFLNRTLITTNHALQVLWPILKLKSHIYSKAKEQELNGFQGRIIIAKQRQWDCSVKTCCEILIFYKLPKCPSFHYSKVSMCPSYNNGTCQIEFIRQALHSTLIIIHMTG